MMLIRKEMGAHDSYDDARLAREIGELRATWSPQLPRGVDAAPAPHAVEDAAPAPLAVEVEMAQVRLARREN